MSAPWWADVATGAPAGVKVFVEPTEVRVEYASVTSRVRAGVAMGVVIVVWTLAVAIARDVAFLGTVFALAMGGVAYRWLSRPTVLRLDAARLSLEDPLRGGVVVSWSDVRDIVLQQAVPADEDSDHGVPASVRVDRVRPVLGSGESLRLGVPLSDDGRAWLLTVVTLFWRSAASPRDRG